MDKRTLAEMFLFKIDRTLAILALGVIAVWALQTGQTDNTVVNSVVTALGMYTGVRLAKQ